MPVATSPRLLDVLTRTAAALTEAVDGDACAISRVIGDLLVLVTQAGGAERPIELDRGFLVSEFPDTGYVLSTGRPRTAHVGQPGVDAAEERLLVDLGYGSLLMLPLVLRRETWGLVEVYRKDVRPFDGSAARAGALVLAALA